MCHKRWGNVDENKNKKKEHPKLEWEVEQLYWDDMKKYKEEKKNVIKKKP